MGVQESHEDAQDALQTLSTLSDVDYEEIVKQLEVISKERYDMQISKWDLMRLMHSLSSIQVKRIMQLLTTKTDPNSVGIHPLMIALVLTRKNLSVEVKVKRLFGLICFEVSTDRIQKSEVNYVFHLAYNWIKVTTKLQLTTSSVQESTEARLFSDPKTETVSHPDTVTWIGKQTAELEQIFAIFTKETRAQREDFKTHQELKNLQKLHVDATGSGLDSNPTRSASKANRPLSTAFGGSESNQGSRASLLNGKGSRAGLHEENKDPQGIVALMNPKELVTEYNPTLKQPQKQLLWNNKILTQLDKVSNQIATANSSLTNTTYTSDSIQLSKMQEKLHVLREQKVIDQDRIYNLIDLNNKFDLIETTNMEFYGQRQLTYMMRSLFYEKQLVNADYSIMNFVKNINQKDLLEEDSMGDIETEESFQFSEVMTRAQTAKSFKEFYRQNLSEIKYEQQMHQTRMLQYLSIRGTRRILEKKKYKCLGEINTLTMILDEAKKRSLIRTTQNAQKVVKVVTKETSRVFLEFPGQESHRTNRQNDSPRKEDTKQQPNNQSLIPGDDWFYKHIYKEFDQLRSCGLSLKDFIELCGLKKQKQRSTCTVSFLEGAFVTLRYVHQVKTFSEVPEYKEFIFQTERMYHEELRVKKKVFDLRQQTKENYNEFCSQLGKLKGFHFIMRQLQAGIEEQDFIVSIKRRMQDLFSRLETIDVQLVQAIQEQIGKKRSNKLYFMATGKVSVYKCISKCLKSVFLANYLAIAQTKLRIQEVFEMTANITAFPQKQTGPELFSQLNGNLFKLIRMIELDKCFNLEANSTDSHLNIEKFQEDLLQIADEERIQGEVTQIENEAEQELQTQNSLEDEQGIPGQIGPTVSAMMKNQLSDHKMDVPLLNSFAQFAHENLPHKDLFPASTENTTNEQSNQKIEALIDQTKTFFFNFVQIEDVFEQDVDNGKEVSQVLRTLSTSMNQADFQEPMNKMMNGLYKAHQSCREYANDMSIFQEPTYVEEFRSSRFKTLNDFMLSLRKANRGPLINNFNMYQMSMPLEHSTRNNFWFAYALNAQIDFTEKEERFKQLIQVASNEISNRKSKFLDSGTDFQPSLAMSCFWHGPCSIFKDANVSPSASEQVLKCRMEFERQYTLTKSEAHREQRFRQSLFADQACFFEMRMKTRGIFVEILDNIVGKRSQIRDLQHLQSMFYDQAYSKHKDNDSNLDLQGLIQRHLELKMKVTDDARHQAITGIFQGADQYLNSLIKRQEQSATSEIQPEGLTKLIHLRKHINAIERTYCYKPNNRKVVRKGAAQPSTISLANHSESGISGKADIPKSALAGMLEQTENQLVEQITRTHCYYKLIGQTCQSKNLFIFFDDIESIKQGYALEVSRRQAMKSYLQGTSRIMDPHQEFQQKHVKELGARLTQDLISGLCISPVFAYSPFEEIVTEPVTMPNSALNTQPVQKTSYEKGGLQRKGTQKSNDVQMLSPKTENLRRQMTRNLAQGRTNSLSSSGSRRMKKGATIAIDSIDNSSKGEHVIAMDEFEPVQEVRKRFQSLELSSGQLTANLTLNFLNEICILDDKITAKQILKNNRFFSYIQMARVVLDSGLAKFNLAENMQLGLQRLLNVFEVQNTPLQRYLINFERISKFIQQELVPAITSTDESHLKFFFFDIMSKKGSALVKQTINKVETYFGLAQLEDADKANFSTAQTKIKRDLDQNLRTFKEFIDLEDNKKVAQRHQAMIKHQDLRLMQEVASLLLLVRTYYLKQNSYSRPLFSKSSRGEQHF